MLPCDCVSAGQVPLLSRLVFRAAAIGVQASTYQTLGGGMTADHSRLTNWRLPPACLCADVCKWGALGCLGSIHM